MSHRVLSSDFIIICSWLLIRATIIFLLEIKSKFQIRGFFVALFFIIYFICLRFHWMHINTEECAPMPTWQIMPLTVSKPEFDSNSCLQHSQIIIQNNLKFPNSNGHNNKEFFIWKVCMFSSRQKFMEVLHSCFVVSDCLLIMRQTFVSALHSIGLDASSCSSVT